MIRFLSVFVVLVTTCLGQVEIAAISTASVHPVLSPDSPDHTFGVEMDPDGIHCYVTVSGALGMPGSTGFMNNRLLKIDLTVGGIVSQALVEFFPEDIVIRTNASGQTETIFVSNTSSGSISAFDSNLSSLGVVNLGNCFGYSMFPFEMVLSPSQSHLYVGSNCAGDLFEIVADPADPNFLQIQTAFTYNEAHSTLDIIPSPQGGYTMVVGGSISDIDPAWNYLGSHAVIDLIDFTTQVTGGTPTTYHVGTSVTGDWASTTDVLPLAGERLLIVENSQTRANILIFDRLTNTVVKTHDLQTWLPGLNSLHQADVGPNGRIVAITSLDTEIVFFDLESENVISSVHHASSVQPSIPRYTLSGDKMVCTYQNEEVVRIFGSLPEGLDLSINGVPSTGSTFSMVATGAVPFSAIGTAFSSFGNTPSIVGIYKVSLTAPFAIFSILPSNAVGATVQNLSVPADPGLIGLTGHFQGFTATPSGGLALSNPLTITVLP